MTNLISYFFQKSVHLLKDVISSEWIQPNGLKHLFISLYNVGVILYRDGRLKEVLLLGSILPFEIWSLWCSWISMILLGCFFIIMDLQLIIFFRLLTSFMRFIIYTFCYCQNIFSLLLSIGEVRSKSVFAMLSGI